MTDEVRFIQLGEDGKQLSVRNIKSSDIAKCPSCIWVPEHYREDGSCRHDEKICEEAGCKNPKTEEEIYCSDHMAILEGGIYA